MLNEGLWQAWPGEWAINGIVRYELVIAPQNEHLAFVCATPYNAVRWLVTTGPEGTVRRLPGLRLEEQIGDTYRLRHLPTGATMSVTAQTSTRPDSDSGHEVRDRRMWRTDTPLNDAERDALADLPSACPASEVLLAGLLVRLCLRDPGRAWAVGTFFDDPLNREKALLPGAVSRRLWGNGTRWELEWSSYPYEEDLVSALTDPVAGLSGAKAAKVRRGWDITFDDALLALRPRR
ncbi:hypothetical protein [Streptomyces sp. NPDC050856]|uniref:hypothetical protein n=1 Tax=Streptomyces sp. NPDC050856 TaxID=3154939 RepID=UPI0033F0D81E